MIEVTNLTKYYGDFRAVNDISFSIPKGQITGLLGPNGAGKTTTMRIVTGYLNSTKGTATIGGLDISKEPTAVKKMIGYLPESAPLYGDMIVYDYLVYAAEMHGITSEDRIKVTAEQCGLIPVMHKNISELSKGYKQRVGLAHAMIHDPEILILDEPTTGLDPNQIIEIRNLIKEIGKEKTVVLSTHILPEVEATCDRIIIINNGTIVADDKTSEIQSSSKGSLVVHALVSGASFEDMKGAFSSIEGVVAIHSDGMREGAQAVRLESTSDKDVRPLVFKTVADKGWTLYEMTRGQNTLEHVFRELTKGGKDE